VIEKRNVTAAIEHDVLVDFVADDVDAGALGQGPDGGHGLGRKHRAGRIAGPFQLSPRPDLIVNWQIVCNFAQTPPVQCASL
jgi:hypothetical protein